MDYKAAVNPTFFTAKATVFMLASVGNDDAKTFIEKMGISDTLMEQGQKNSDNPMPEEERKALMIGTTLAVETRYAAISRIIEHEGYTNMLDIACGYTPRSLYCYKKGMGYVGVDVPAVTDQLQEKVESEYPGKTHATYVSGDATNAASLLEAANLLKGELMISCEGLLQYLSENEFVQFLGGVRQILKVHGGAWYSSDMSVDYDQFAVRNMDSPDAITLYHESRKRVMAQANIYNDGVANWEENKMEKFLEDNGFKVEKLPFYHGDEELAMLRAIRPEKKEAILDQLNGSSIWKMTIDPGFKEDEAIEGAKKVENLSITFNVEKGILSCKTDGRIDTISAPALLEVLDCNSEGVNEVRINAKNLEYISSAGLRVLLMAVKRHGEGAVSVYGASEPVKEIFATTGFDQMIRIE